MYEREMYENHLYKKLHQRKSYINNRLCYVKLSSCLVGLGALKIPSSCEAARQKCQKTEAGWRAKIKNRYGIGVNVLALVRK